MQIFRKGERPSKPAPQEYFTGSVTITPINEAPEPATLRALHVAFTAGARTHWHTHPLGQTLHVVSGRGLIQCRGEAAQIIEPGDTVWIPPHIEHWHGATAGSAMAHIAMQERLEGSDATWADPVSAEEYDAAPVG